MYTLKNNGTLWKIKNILSDQNFPKTDHVLCAWPIIYPKPGANLALKSTLLWI